MERDMDGLNPNMGKAIGQGENNPQVLNPPQTDPPLPTMNQPLRALRDHVVPPVIQPVIRAPPISLSSSQSHSS